jgi:beta-lactamase class A
MLAVAADADNLASVHSESTPFTARFSDAFAPTASDSAGVAWSAAVLDARTGETVWEHDPDRVLKTASVGKLFLLIELARRAEAGEIDLAELVTRTPEEWVADSGVWHLLAADSLPIADAAALIGAMSDNLATNVLVRRLGIEAIAATTRALGFERSALLDRVRDERLPEHPPTLSQGSAGELARLVAALHCGEIVSPAVSDRVLDWMALNTDLSMVASAFGLDPLAHQDEDRGIILRNKTGTISTARIDVGVVSSGDRAFAYAVLANWDGAPGDPRDAVLARMAELGRSLRAAVV